MSSEVEIANLALSNIRAGSINSFSESSLQAQQCTLKYPVLRDMLLKDAPWGFAHMKKPLTLLDVEVFGWAFVYQYPVDCLYINRIILNYTEVESGVSALSTRYYDRNLYGPNLDKQVEYEIFNVDGIKVIVSNESELRIDYRGKVTDPNLFDSEFILALSHLLAAEIAVPIIGMEGGMSARNQEMQFYGAYVNAAIASHMNEKYTEVPDSEYITGRN